MHSLTPVQLLGQWLLLLKIPVSKQYVEELLLSHPYYPSLLSITDTLGELGIEHAAVKIEREQYKEIPVPFLAHINSIEGDFAIISDNQHPEKLVPDFFKRWSGIVVAATKPEQWTHAVNDRYIKKDKKKNFRLWAYAFCFTVLTAVAAVMSLSWISTGLFLIAALGVFISFLIISKELGIQNKIADQVCGRDKDCDTVITSKKTKLPGGISWGDVGVTWFLAVLLQLILAAFTGTLAASLPVLSWLAVATLPFTVFSVYYQWRVAKKWCRLCLITVGLLWTQFALLLPVLLNNAGTLAVNPLLFLLAIVTVTAGVWIPVKGLLSRNKELNEKKYDLRRFKNNPDVFMLLLQQQRQVEYKPFEHDMQLGNPRSPFQVTVACSPYCAPCTYAHNQLHQLVEQHDIGLTVRFTFSLSNKEDTQVKVARHVLQHIASVNNYSPHYKKQLLHHWFAGKDYEKFCRQYPVTNAVDVEDTLKRQEQWVEKAAIQFTPTIFINGYELPREYRVSELDQLIKGCTELMKIAMPATATTPVESELV